MIELDVLICLMREENSMITITSLIIISKPNIGGTRLQTREVFPKVSKAVEVY